MIMRPTYQVIKCVCLKICYLNVHFLAIGLLSLVSAFDSCVPSGSSLLLSLSISFHYAIYLMCMFPPVLLFLSVTVCRYNRYCLVMAYNPAVLFKSHGNRQKRYGILISTVCILITC